MRAVGQDNVGVLSQLGEKFDEQIVGKFKDRHEDMAIRALCGFEKLHKLSAKRAAEKGADGILFVRIGIEFSLELLQRGIAEVTLEIFGHELREDHAAIEVALEAIAGCARDGHGI